MTGIEEVIVSRFPEQSDRTASATLVAGDSLAGWLNRLGPGSPCFCCGSPLVPLAASSSGTGDDATLVCPACGAKIRDEVAVIAPATFRRSRAAAALFAA